MAIINNMPKAYPSSPSKSLDLVLELGTGIKLTIMDRLKTGDRRWSTVNLDNWVANFQEAVDIPAKYYCLKDFCGFSFFRRKAGLTPLEVYKRTLDGDPDGAELFVEYGSNVGALVANLEILLQPATISICGPLAETSDAWSHSMGKSRKKHLGKKPAVKINIDKADS